jgi:ubiquinone/menaquinone biosynthesis C-methylase UbiE
MKPGEYETMFRVEDHHWWYRALRRVVFGQLRRFLPDCPAGPILDVGCGTAANLLRLNRLRPAVGLDLSAEALRLAKRRGGVSLVRGNALELPFHDEAFAAVVSTSVLYHRWVPDVGQALAEFDRVLLPGGLVVIDLPAFDSLYGAHDEAVMTARRFRAGEVRRLVEEQGWRVLRMRYWNSWLFPAAVVMRRLSRGQREVGDLEESVPSQGATNALMDRWMAAEWQMIQRIPLPFGVSINCVAQKRRV